MCCISIEFVLFVLRIFGTGMISAALVRSLDSDLVLCLLIFWSSSGRRYDFSVRSFMTLSWSWVMIASAPCARIFGFICAFSCRTSSQVSSLFSDLVGLMRVGIGF